MRRLVGRQSAPEGEVFGEVVLDGGQPGEFVVLVGLRAEFGDELADAGVQDGDALDLVVLEGDQVGECFFEFDGGAAAVEGLAEDAGDGRLLAEQREGGGQTEAGEAQGEGDDQPDPRPHRAAHGSTPRVSAGRPARSATVAAGRWGSIAAPVLGTGRRRARPPVAAASSGEVANSGLGIIWP